MGAALCLTRVIQNAPVQALQATLSFITGKLLEALQSSRSQTQVIEALISLVLAVERDFGPHCGQFVPALLEFLRPEAQCDWTVRKIAIDLFYTLANIVKEALAPFKYDILEALGETRTDKLKPVREASLEAITVVKELPSPKGRGRQEASPRVKKPSREEQQRQSTRLQQKPKASARA